MDKIQRNELYELRAANQLANHLLEKSATPITLEDLSHEHKPAEKTSCTSGYSKDGISETVRKSSVFQNDRWGASEYLQNDHRFEFVRDYFQRAEELQNMTNYVKALNIPKSYEIVNSTRELLSNSRSDSQDVANESFSRRILSAIIDPKDKEVFLTSDYISFPETAMEQNENRKEFMFQVEEPQLENQNYLCEEPKLENEITEIVSTGDYFASYDITNTEKSNLNKRKGFKSKNGNMHVSKHSLLPVTCRLEDDKENMDAISTNRNFASSMGSEIYEGDTPFYPTNHFADFGLSSINHHSQILKIAKESVTKLEVERGSDDITHEIYDVVNIEPNRRIKLESIPMQSQQSESFASIRKNIESGPINSTLPLNMIPFQTVKDPVTSDAVGVPYKSKVQSFNENISYISSTESHASFTRHDAKLNRLESDENGKNGASINSVSLSISDSSNPTLNPNIDSTVKLEPNLEEKQWFESAASLTDMENDSVDTIYLKADPFKTTNIYVEPDLDTAPSRSKDKSADVEDIWTDSSLETSAAFAWDDTTQSKLTFTENRKFNASTNFASLTLSEINSPILEIPKLDLSELNCKKVCEQTEQRPRKAQKSNMCLNDSTIHPRKQLRPSTADSPQKRNGDFIVHKDVIAPGPVPRSISKVNSGEESPKKRHGSADKLLRNKSASPKRVWEKSSTAWSSYGKNQLSTWSSLQRPPSPTKMRGKPIKNKLTILKQNRETIADHFRSIYSPIIKENSNLELRNMWQNLPEEIIIYLFSFLSLKDLCNVALVCHRFHSLAEDCHLWRSLNASGIVISDQWLEAMGRRRPKSITIANCKGKQITNKGLRNLFQNCKHGLEHLHVNNCSGEFLTGDSVLLHASCHCKQIKCVEVPWSRTTDNGLSAVSLAVSGIECININGNSAIGDESFDLLRQHHSFTLRVLEMSGCFAVSCTTLLSLLQESKFLTTLNLGLCSKVTAECIITFSKSLKALKKLDLHGVKSVTNRCLHAISNHCRQLQTLILSNCIMISDTGIAEIATYLPTLLHLDINGCSQVSDQGITNFLSVSKDIQHLDLSNTGATHISVDLIMHSCASTLTTLKLSFCRNITQSSIEKLLNVAILLKLLHLYGCKRIKLSALIKANKNVLIEK